MQAKTKTHALIDQTIEAKQGKGFRNHLGASVIGKPCAREIWYIFRWAKQVQHKARILRLFDRGNLEEERFVSWLRKSGIHVVDRDPDTGKQLRITDHDEHFGGSLDANIFDSPDFPQEWALGEFKTHNDKSFKDLKKNGLKKSKETHFIQMQIYLHYSEYEGGLYMAINKNTDELYVEVVQYEKEVAEKYILRAKRIIDATEPPARVNGASPGWYICRWCDFTEVCHNGAPMEMNCRTCQHSTPIEKGQWKCLLYDFVLSREHQLMGCQSHEPILSD